MRPPPPHSLTLGVVVQVAHRNTGIGYQAGVACQAATRAVGALLAVTWAAGMTTCATVRVRGYLSPVYMSLALTQCITHRGLFGGRVIGGRVGGRVTL